MSLTSELKDRNSPIARFLRETFPHTTRHVKTWSHLLRQVAPIVNLPNGTPPYVYGQVGTALDYRIRYHFALTPGERFVAARGANDVIRAEDAPLRTALPISEELRIPEESKLTQACVEDFFRTLDQAVAEIAPHRRVPTKAEERTLARFCLVLTAFEVVFWAGRWPPPYFGDAPPASAAELHALVPDDWIEDAAALGATFVKEYPAWHGADANLNPKFAGSPNIGGADADFIVDSCLWDIKTTKTGTAQGAWLHQLLGYTLLDYDDEYGIDRVGLLLPRQGTSISWPLAELIADLSGRPDLDFLALRKRFRALCEQAFWQWLQLLLLADRRYLHSLELMSANTGEHVDDLLKADSWVSKRIMEVMPERFFQMVADEDWSVESAAADDGGLR